MSTEEAPGLRSFFERYWIALSGALAVAVALVLRFRHAAETYLNPDEAAFFNQLVDGSFAERFWSGFWTHHPPLLIWLYYGVQLIDTSEVALRTIPVLAGVAFPVVFGGWVALHWNRFAGLVAALMLLFAPEMVNLSAEARGYTLAYLGMAGYLYCLDRSLRDTSVRWMAAAGGWLVAGALAEYSMALIAAAAGIYALVRFRDVRPPRRVLAAWVVVQSVGVALYGFLYVAQIRPQTLNPNTAEDKAGWLRAGFYWPDESLLEHVLAGLRDQFVYFFAFVPAAALGVLLWLFGMGLLWRGKGEPAERKHQRAVLLLTLLVFAFGVAVNLAGYLPLFRSRHTSYYSLFIAAGIAIALEPLCRGRRYLVLGAVAVVPFWFWVANGVGVDLDVGRQQRPEMTEAIAAFREQIPAGAVVLTDKATDHLLRYYLGESYSSYRLVNKTYTYPDQETVLADVERLTQEFPGEADYWFVDAGWTLVYFEPGLRSGRLRLAEADGVGAVMLYFRFEVVG